MCDFVPKNSRKEVILVSLCAEFVNTKKLHDEARKASKNALDSRKKALDEMNQVKQKYEVKIRQLHKGNGPNYNSKRYEYLCKIHSAEEVYNNACKNFDAANDILNEHKQNLDSISEKIVIFINVPKNCQENIRIKESPVGYLNVYFNTIGKSLKHKHGHIVLKDDTITYRRKLNERHGSQNFIINSKPTVAQHAL